MFYYHLLELIQTDQIHIINKMEFEKNVILVDLIVQVQCHLEFLDFKVNTCIIHYVINNVQATHFC